MQTVRDVEAVICATGWTVVAKDEPLFQKLEAVRESRNPC
jgi:hypothetical protein